MYRNILVPLDGSSNSKRALDEAINCLKIWFQDLNFIRR